jgi:hypothetical protein
MSYFIFAKNLDNVEGTLCSIAENNSDLTSLNIDQSNYKIIEVSQTNFDAVKYGTKKIIKYNSDNIIYINIEDILARPNTTHFFNTKENLNNYIENYKNRIKQFTENNKNHSLFDRWNNYYNQLNSLNLDSITYPLDKSLEQYFKDQNQTSLSPLQIP